jgi:hypothetical protein
MGIKEVEDEEGEEEEEFFDAVEDQRKVEAVVEDLPTLVRNLTLKKEVAMAVT